MEEKFNLTKITENLDYFIKDLENKRLYFQKKNKGLLGRAFLRTWGLLGGSLILLQVALAQDKAILDDLTTFILVPAIPTALVSIIGAVIYSFSKKTGDKKKFTEELKMVIVPKVLSSVNPNLTYFNKGIAEADFAKSELFVRRYFKSEDTIAGTIKGKKVIISECNANNLSAGNDSIKASTLTPFKGIFAELELENIHLSTPLKIIPSFAAAPILKNKSVLEEFGRGKKRPFRKCFVEKEDLINLPNSENIINYKVFCEDSKVAKSFLKPNTAKVIDYIFNKYESIKESAFTDSALFREVNHSTGIYFSIIKNKLYLAFDWNGNLFEPSSLLKEGVEKSGLVQNIHRDLQVINQIIKEASLLDEVNG